MGIESEYELLIHSHVVKILLCEINYADDEFDCPEVGLNLLSRGEFKYHLLQTKDELAVYNR